MVKFINIEIFVLFMKHLVVFDRMALEDLNNLLGVKDYCTLGSRNLPQHLELMESHRFRRW